MAVSLVRVSTQHGLFGVRTRYVDIGVTIQYVPDRMGARSFYIRSNWVKWSLKGTEVRERQDTDRFSRLTPSIFIEESEADPIPPSTHRRLNDGLLLMLCVLGILLFFPFGLLAFYQLLKARTLFKEGKIPAARTRAFYAQILSLLAVLFGMVWVGLVIGLTV